METLAYALGAISALGSAVAFIIYDVQTLRDGARPNIVSWSIWVATSILNLITYREMSGDFVVSMPYYIGAVGSALTFLFVLLQGSIAKPKFGEIVVFVLAVVATMVWWYGRSAAWGNMILLAAFLISWVPTFRGALADPSKEPHEAWLIWAGAFSLAAITVLLRWDGNVPTLLFKLAGPTALVITHSTIAMLSSHRRRYQLAVRL